MGDFEVPSLWVRSHLECCPGSTTALDQYTNGLKTRNFFFFFFLFLGFIGRIQDYQMENLDQNPQDPAGNCSPQ